MMLLQMDFGEFFGGVTSGLGTNWLYFGSDSDDNPDPDPSVFTRDSRNCYSAS